MFRQWLNWRTALAFVAILIVSGTIFYSQYLSRKIASEERQKVEEWIEASNALLNPNISDTRLPLKIINDNDDIPIIWTNERDSIIDHINLDTSRLRAEPGYLANTLSLLRKNNPPITWVDPLDPRKVNRYYYGHTTLLQEVRYYPIIQLVIVGLFILITILALRGNYRSMQNQLWAGMAKETAHQLGTPVSSLEGWVEVLRETPAAAKYAAEIEKDVHRLQLVTDRFGKIGSTPKLETVKLNAQVQQVIDYIRKRAGSKVTFDFASDAADELDMRVSPPLFDWVIENLLKNALDAMDGQGRILVQINNQPANVYIDVTDNGKGISKVHRKKVFHPGFTTKKRGWGLGLTLTKRIIEQYHGGQIFVKWSEQGKGTTFRIILPKG